jgi:hypothetical protein
MQHFIFAAYILIKGVATMVVKINNKPIQVTEDQDEVWYKEVDWFHISMTTIAYLLVFHVLDLAAASFLGAHPFPFIKFIGVILSWFGIS